MGEDGVEFEGRTVEDAIARAEAELGTNRTDLNIDVVSAGSRGVFGIGAENAKILVRRPQPVAATVSESEEPTVSRPEAEPASVEREREPEELEPEADERDPARLPSEAAEVLRELLRTMGFDAEVTVRSTEDPVMLAITGTNLGVLIGRRGDNLAALQFMVNLLLSKNRRQWPRVVVDVENYRARREESLRSLADRIAFRVRRSQRPFTLEAMPAGDRRVIHLSLRDQPEVETYSIGEGVARRVVIAPKRDNGYR